MRRAYLVLLAAGCGFRSPEGGVAMTVPDGGVADMHAFTLAELGAGQGIDMTVDGPRSALTPTAYTYGGLVAHGRQGAKLWEHGATSWAMLDGFVSTGAGLWTGERIANGAATDYLGVVGDPMMTLWLEGEVWLDSKSTEQFGLSADDVAFIELARPGTTSFARVIENAPAMPQVLVQTPDTGWYPIRIGFSNGDATFNFQFTHSDAGGALVGWTRDRLRARASELGGALRTVFGRQILGGGLPLGGGQIAPPVPHFEQSELLRTGLQNPPQGAQVNDDDWSARYAAQVYITKPGMYTLQIDSDDGNRGRLGAGHDDAHWRRDDGVGPMPTKTTASAMLVTGWNDLSVDYNQAIGGSTLRVRIQGPDFPALIEIPADKLRPVEPSDDRLALGVDGNSYNVPDGDAAHPGTATMTVAGYAAATGAAEVIDSIELTYQINSPHADQLKLELETPGSPGTRVAIRDRDRGNGDGDRTTQFAVPSNPPAALAGLLAGTVGGDWKLRVSDVQGGGGSSSLLSARLTLHTKAGPDKIARTASWTSPILDAGTPVFAVDSVTWNERMGSGIQVRVRTCQQADCSGAGWPEPVAKATPFAVSRGRYLQLKVEMTSNGTLEPELSAPVIAFRRDPG